MHAALAAVMKCPGAVAPRRLGEAASTSCSHSRRPALKGARQRRQYDEDLEEGLDRAYSEYLARHGQREQAAEAKRARLQKTPRGLDGELVEEADEEAAAAADVQAPVHEVRLPPAVGVWGHAAPRMRWCVAGCGPAAEPGHPQLHGWVGNLSATLSACCHFSHYVQCAAHAAQGQAMTSPCAGAAAQPGLPAHHRLHMSTFAQEP